MTSKSCYDSACTYLARRPHSEHELHAKLRVKGFEEDEIGDVIARLKDGGYINDADYCQLYGESRVKRLNIGPDRLRYDLMTKGFDDRLIGDTISSIYCDRSGELEFAKMATRKKLYTMKVDLAEDVLRKKIFEHLRRKGFSSELARHVALDLLGKNNEGQLDVL
jgi:regulatory protein